MFPAFFVGIVVAQDIGKADFQRLPEQKLQSAGVRHTMHGRRMPTRLYGNVFNG